MSSKTMILRALAVAVGFAVGMKGYAMYKATTTKTAGPTV